MGKYLVLLIGGISLSLYETLDDLSPDGYVYSEFANQLTDSKTYCILNNTKLDVLSEAELKSALSRGSDILCVVTDQKSTAKYKKWAEQIGLGLIVLNTRTSIPPDKVQDLVYYKLKYMINRLSSDNPNDTVGYYLQELSTKILAYTTPADQSRFTKYISTALRYT